MGSESQEKTLDLLPSVGLKLLEGPGSGREVSGLCLVGGSAAV